MAGREHIQILRTGHALQQDAFPASPIRNISLPFSFSEESQRKGGKKEQNLLLNIVPSWEADCPLNGIILENRVGKNDSPQHVYSKVVLFPALSLG